MSIWMNVLGELRIIRAKMVLLESRVAPSQTAPGSLGWGGARREPRLNRANSDAEELRRELLLPKSLCES